MSHIKSISTFHAIAWLIWSLFSVNCGIYIMAPFVDSKIKVDLSSQSWFKYFILALIVASILEALLTIIIRYYAITRPYKRGRYNPHDSFARFFITAILNWIICNSIALYGTILYYMSGIYWTHILFASIGAVLLIYHSPRLGKFEGKVFKKE